jgi:hypothetical protein
LVVYLLTHFYANELFISDVGSSGTELYFENRAQILLKPGMGGQCEFLVTLLSTSETYIFSPLIRYKVLKKINGKNTI